MRERSLLEARRAAAQDATRPSDRVAIASALLGAVIVTVVLILRGILWSGPAMPSVPLVLDPDSGQQPAHVQSAAVPSDAHP
jgi:hypothetical protein